MKGFAADCMDLEAWEDKLGEEELIVEHETELKANEFTTLLVACGLLLGSAIAILIGRSITGSLASMLRMIQKIAAKDLVVEDIEVTSHDEIGQSEVALNSMKNTLHRMGQSIASTAEHRSRSNKEISTAAGQDSETARPQSAPVKPPRTRPPRPN